MKLTKKIKLLLIPLTMIPVIFIVCMFLFLSRNYVNQIYGQNVKDAAVGGMGNPVAMVISSTNEAVNILRYTALNTPEKLENEEYLNQMSEMLKESKATLLVRIDDEWIYQDQEVDDNLLAELSTYSLDNSSLSFFLEKPDSYFVRCQRFDFSEDKSGAFYVVTYMGNSVRYFRGVLIKMMFSLILTMMMISAVISLFMYRNVVMPVKVLEEGTKRIKDGDLNFEIIYGNDDELGELCESFNEMRDKLKESIDVRMEYEEQNRELISNISHDLKTPITSIKGYVEGIMDGVADTPEKMDRYIKTIYNKANEMDILINELSLYTQITNNQIPYNLIPLNLDQYFEDCVSELSMDMERRAVAITCKNHCDKKTEVLMDPEQMKRVINNIVFNAEKYRKKEECKISIRIRKIDEEKVRVEIEDNGIGIDEKDLPNIFDRTYRADTARRSQGGSGLGLSICKKVVNDHGGEIWATSKKDHGTTIYFTMPIYKKDEMIGKKEEDNRE